MVDAANPAHNPNQNDPLQRRRDEKAAEQIIQDTTQRFTDLAACSLEAWQKNVDIASQVTRFWADTLENNQKVFGQVVNQLQQYQQNQRRAG